MRAPVPLVRRAAMAATVGSAVVLLTGCSAAGEREAGDVAVSFEDSGGTPEGRCELLLPAAALEEDSARSCPDAIGQLNLPGGAVEAVSVWGDAAQVRMTGDTVFLARTPTGWRVSAAGCRSRGEAPYDCEVESP